MGNAIRKTALARERRQLNGAGAPSFLIASSMAIMGAAYVSEKKAPLPRAGVIRSSSMREVACVEECVCQREL